MTLKDSIENDASAIFTSTDDFAEAITYNFRTGTTRALNAIVNREPYSFFDATGNASMASMTIVIPTVVDGVLASEIDTGGDSVSLALKVGGTVVNKAVLAILNQDFGAIKLALT
jgi:hypothetical protein